MRKRSFEPIKGQRGEVMLEASIVLVPVLLLLMALLSLSFLFYQQAMMTSVATEIAADIAKNYKYTEMDVGESTISLDDVISAKMFRMNFGKNSLEEEHAARSEEYAEWRIGAASLGLREEDIEVTCEITNSGVGRAYVQVTVSQRTDFFLSSVLNLLGIAEEDSLFTATAYAECIDLMGYTSMVNFTEYGSRQLEVFNSVGSLYNNVKEFVKELLD